ncbi:MAG: hypothetical protein QM736_29870 [Vicinamibacterales bacterium]
MPNASDRYIHLRGGFVIPLEPWSLAADLELRGFRLFVDGGDLLVIPGPNSQLSDVERQALRRWKPHVLALLAYQPAVMEQVQ